MVRFFERIPRHDVPFLITEKAYNKDVSVIVERSIRDI